MHRRILDLLPLCALLLVGACGPDFPDDPCAAARGLRAELQQKYGVSAGGGRAPGGMAWTLDHEFALAARLIPGGFGGLYYDNDNTGAQKIAIVLVDVGKTEEAVQALVISVHCGALFPGAPFASLTVSSVVVHQGQYDAGQLLDWRVKVSNSVHDWTLLDLDEVRNRIVVGISSESNRAAMEQQISAAGIPQAAVVIVIAGPVVLDDLR